MRSLDPLQPLANVRLLDQDLALSLAPRRFVMMLLATFAVAAVALAAIGIYGVIFYMVGWRTREFGVRMALGARPGQVMQLVMGQAARQMAAGIALGTAARSAPPVCSRVSCSVSPAWITGPQSWSWPCSARWPRLRCGCRRAARQDPIHWLRCGPNDGTRPSRALREEQ